MSKKTLAELITEDSHCLWEAVRRFIMEEYTPEDCRTTGGCYRRLKLAVSVYYETRGDGLDEDELWFATTVLDAYKDLYERKIIKSN